MFSELAPDPRLRRVCRQVQRRLDMVLGSELDDPALQGLWVDAVVPEAGGRSLLVYVVVPELARVDAVLTHLNAAGGLLRREVAAAIHRKRAPTLRFIVVPPPRADDPRDGVEQ